MVCYARTAYGITGIAVVILVIFGRAAAHYLDVAALLTAVLTVLGGAAVTAAAVFLSLRSVRRRRALAGGCVGCQFRCQHAMTDFAPGQHTRLWLVRSVDRGVPQVDQSVPVGVRGASATGRTWPAREPIPDRPPVVMMPVPRWPDRPLRNDMPAQQQKVQVSAGAR